MARLIELSGGATPLQKLRQFDWLLLILLTAVASIGFIALYSAAEGSFTPWAEKQIVYFLLGVAVMVVAAFIDIRFWYRMAYPIYGGCLFLLIVVALFGHIGMGAQRWINLGFIQVQPSEMMKIAVVLALARYFSAAPPENLRRLGFLAPAAALIALPVGLVMLQPDLGTAIMICLAGAAMFWLGGAPLWLFLAGFALAAAAAPVGWHFLHDYQKKRLLIFWHPETDPLGAGYHIMQSKIALGSGGIRGRGFLRGTQSHLNFLPEKQTDFIFTLWAEEWGLFGGLALLALFSLIFLYCGWMAFRVRHSFGRLLAFGLMINFSLYVFVNVAMVMGLMPVVGTPLPLVSYGGTAMLSLMGGFGLLMSCHQHRDAKLAKM